MVELHAFELHSPGSIGAALTDTDSKRATRGAARCARKPGNYVMNEHNDVALQALARAEHGVPATIEACRTIWQQLVTREMEVAACFAAEKRCYLAVRPSSAKREPLTGRNLEMLERALLGVQRKAI